MLTLAIVVDLSIWAKIEGWWGTSTVDAKCSTRIWAGGDTVRDSRILVRIVSMRIRSWISQVNIW